MDAKTFAKVFAAVAEVASTDKKRTALFGVYAATDRQIVATNGHALVAATFGEAHGLTAGKLYETKDSVKKLKAGVAPAVLVPIPDAPPFPAFEQVIPPVETDKIGTGLTAYDARNLSTVLGVIASIQSAYGVRTVPTRLQIPEGAEHPLRLDFRSYEDVTVVAVVMPMRMSAHDFSYLLTSPSTKEEAA